MTPKRLVAALGLVVLVTSLLILILIFISKLTVVEFIVLTKRFTFTVLLRQETEDRIKICW